MSERGKKTYRSWEPERYRQDAQSPTAKLPEGDLVFFLLDTVPQLELSDSYRIRKTSLTRIEVKQDKIRPVQVGKA